MRLILFLVFISATALACERQAVDSSQPPVDRSPVAATNSERPERPERQPRSLPRPARPDVEDQGLLSTYDPEVEVSFPDWLADAPELRIRGPSGDVFAFVQGRAVALAPDQNVDLEVESFGDADLDGDGIPNALDVLLGAKKTVENNAPYGSPYREIEYPGGDVPLTEGVCTDTLVRTMRNGGLDLQKDLHEDILRSPSSFPMVKKPNPNIDHRRVKTLLPYFERQWESLPTTWETADVWLPGDVLFMDTYGDDRPDHVGIVSDTLGPSGLPKVINNWTDGYSTSEMDVAPLVPITHRFRIRQTLDVPSQHRGLGGVLNRSGLELADEHRQVVLVTTPAPGWPHGWLRRYEKESGEFESVGDPVRVTIGSAGLGTGRGLHPDDWRGTPHQKQEGDRRAPAGIFGLGAAFGPHATPPYQGEWPWRSVSDDDVFVDDPNSRAYNTWQSRTAAERDWKSAERLSMYELGLVVRHNTDETRPGAGSAIFLHTWQGKPRPTLGCTAAESEDLRELLEWLEPEKSPVLVQLSGQVFGG